MPACCAVIPTILSGKLSILQAGTLYLLNANSPSPLCSPLAATIPLCLSEADYPKCLIKQNHTLFLSYFPQCNCYWMQVCVPNAQWGPTNQKPAWSWERFISRPSKKTSGSGPPNPELLKGLEVYWNPHLSGARTWACLIISDCLLGVKHLICLLHAIWGVLPM